MAVASAIRLWSAAALSGSFIWGTGWVPRIHSLEAEVWALRQGFWWPELEAHVVQGPEVLSQKLALAGQGQHLAAGLVSAQTVQGCSLGQAGPRWGPPGVLKVPRQEEAEGQSMLCPPSVRSPV